LVNRGKDQYQEESSDEEEVVVKKRKQSKKPDADVLNKIVINEEVRKYIDSTFRPFPFTSEQLSNEYERVKGMARDAMTVHLMTGSEEALNMVKSLEDNAFQIQMVATDSKVAQKLSLLQNNALWRNNVEKVQIATKLAKLDQKEAKTGTNGYQKANLMAKAFNPKNPKEEKDERKETPNRNFGEKRCFKCQSPHHLLNQCPMNDVNKHPRSEYLPFCFLFTRGDPGEIQSYPQHFQPVEGLGTKKCFTRSSRNAKGRCSCRGFRGVQKVPWKGQSRQMGPKGKGMVSERISYPQGNRCYRALSEVVAKYRLVPKRDSYRLIIDLRPLNKYCKVARFKFKTLKKFLEFVPRTGETYGYMFDMKSGYHQLKIHPSARKYFAIEINGELWQFTVLPFGWNGSPFVFTCVMNEFVKMLRSDSLYLSNYLDDIGILHFGGFVTALKNLAMISMVCTELGIVIEQSKSVLQPMKQFKLLGMIVDLESKTLTMTTATILKIRHRIGLVLKASYLGLLITARDLFKITGIVIAYLDCFQPAQVMLNPIYSLVSRMVNTGGWDCSFFLKEKEVIHNLRWITANLEFWNGRLFQFPSLVNYFWTDASRSGWGAFFKEENLKIHGKWSQTEKARHINELEVKAIWIALNQWKDRLRGKNLIIYTDSMVALSVIKKGSAKSPAINRMIISIWRTIFDNNIQLLSLEWLPSKENEVADQLSRIHNQVSDPTDWEVTRAAFKRVQQLLNVSVGYDRFASHYNFKVEPYCTQRRVRRNEVADAFSHLWREPVVNWCCVPFNLIGRVLMHCQESKAEMILIHPVWRTRWWWPLLQDHQVRFTYMDGRDFRPTVSGNVNLGRNLGAS